MQYVPFISDIEIPFYASLASHKINHAQLDDAAQKVLGIYEIRPNDPKEHSCRMQILANALTADTLPGQIVSIEGDQPDALSSTGVSVSGSVSGSGSASSKQVYRAEGMIKNVNTIEDYRNLDKAALLNRAGRTIWEAINDGTIYECPSLLASFMAISFADLKKYRFSYWFAFPALALDPPWTPVAGGGGANYQTLSPLASTALVEEVQDWRGTVDARQYGFFLAKKSRRPRRQPVLAREDAEGSVVADPEHAGRPSEGPKVPFAHLGFHWVIAPLSDYENGFYEGEYSDDCYVCFADPSNYTAEAGQVAPGWMLRNLLALVRQRWKRDRIQILCYRETPGKRDAARSVIFDMEVSRPTSKKGTSEPSTPSLPTEMPKVVGWERNAAGKLVGKYADLTEYMDPKKLADSSVDLNLKLMKWRIAPHLDLDAIKNTKCLLLGAGTLGSYVSRNLMGWGVRKITFVDNAGVSFSNPVRQPLFTFQDCLNGGQRKATRAAEALKEVYPGVESEGVVMSVPMIGHPVMDATKTKAEYERLESLIDEHDVVFLLMDTRESRWLPTVMGKAKRKIVMNAALGFDTYVVMRHGVKAEQAGQQELGCYFCNDVVAPQDSMQDRTLDQQCTVTRPGVAAIASALLVELLVSILQHPDRAAAAPPTSANDDRGEHPLGLVPHQTRGFLSNFTNVNVVGQSYDCCSACSDKVVDAFRQAGWSFVEKALNDKNYVEELSGLKEVQRQAEAAAAAMEADLDEEDGFGDSEGELL